MRYLKFYAEGKKKGKGGKEERKGGKMGKKSKN